MKDYREEFEEETGRRPILAKANIASGNIYSDYYTDWLQSQLKDRDKKLKAVEDSLMSDEEIHEMYSDLNGFAEDLAIIYRHGAKFQRDRVKKEL